MSDDQRLLMAYVREGSRPALEELVRRNLPLVYSSALRQLRDPDMADDVTQAVFLVLAQKAKTIRTGMAVAGWLLTVTRHASINLLKKKAAEKRHELMTAQSINSSKSNPAWEEVLPHLDAELNRLSSVDRDAVVLRYFQGRSFSDIGTELNLSEDAAQKRVSRALNRLRKLLTRRGITLPAATLAVLLGLHTVHAAPAHLVACALATASTGTAAAASTSLANSIITVMAWLKFKIAAGVILAALFLGASAFELGVLATGNIRPQSSATAAAIHADAAFAISGIVVDAAGQPAAGAIIQNISAGGPSAKSRSTSDGKFTLALTTEAERYGSFQALSADGRSMGYGRINPRSSGSDARELRLVLRPTANIKVHVVREDSQPISGAQVVAFADYLPLAQTQSDAQGLARLDLPADAPLSSIAAFKPGTGLDYQLFWQKETVRNDPYHLDPVTTDDLTLVLNGIKPAQVHVVDGHGIPLAGAKVNPWYFSKPKKGGDLNVSLDAFNRFTDERGGCSFDIIPADNQKRITFWAGKDGYAALDRFEFDPKGASHEITATLLKKVTIGGHVLDDQGQPVAGATVRAGGAAFTTDEFRGFTTTASDGSYLLTVAPWMYYALAAQKAQEASDVHHDLIATESPPAINLYLHEAHRVYGHVTIGPQKAPSRKSYISLTMVDDSYNDLPLTDRKLPHADNRVVSIFIEQSVSTDAEGFYEFYVPDGKYYVQSDIGEEDLVEHFLVADQMENEINLNAKSPVAVPAQRTGRAVRADKPDIAIPEVMMEGTYVQPSNSRAPEGVADKDGRFTLPAADADYFLASISPDRKWGDFRMVTAAENPILLSLSPTSSATGRILDDQGRPIADQDILWSTQIVTAEGGFEEFGNVLGGMGKTNKNGEFIADGLLLGRKYRIYKGTLSSNSANPRDKKLAEITPQSAEPMRLGDLRLVITPAPPTQQPGPNNPGPP